MATNKAKPHARTVQPQPVPTGVYTTVAAFNENIQRAIAGLEAIALLPWLDDGGSLTYAAHLLRRIRAQVSRDCALTLAERETATAGFYDRLVMDEEDDMERARR